MTDLFTIDNEREVAHPINDCCCRDFFANEQELHKFVQRNLVALFDVRFVAEQYRILIRSKKVTKERRIDTVGISQDNCPVLIEYKKGKGDKAVPQILSYLNAFKANKEKFILEASKALNISQDDVNFDKIRLICLARRYDEFVLESSEGSESEIELVTYRCFDNNTLMLEWEVGRPPVRQNSTFKPAPRPAPSPVPNIKTAKRTLQYAISQCNKSTKDLYYALSQGIANLGKDVTPYERSRLNKFKTSRLFAVVRPFPKKDKVTILVKLDPKQEDIIPGFTRDTTSIATEANVCPLEITVRNQQQVKKALDLCRKAYNQSRR